MLRFGDGSPFPLGEGFLDLLVDAVNACALMLGAAANLDQKRAAADAIRRELAEEARRLAELEHSVEHATAPCRPANVRLGRTSERAAEQMLRAAREVLEQSRGQLERKIARRATNPSWHRTARRVEAAAGRFFDRNSLPGTSWSWWWEASGDLPRAEALAESRRFATMFDLDVVPLWRHAIRIDALVPGLALPLPQRRLFREPVVGVVALARYLLVYAHRDASGRVLELRDPNGATGWRVELPDQGQASATAIDRKGRELGVALVADDEIAPLVRAIDEAMILHLRVRRARSTSLDGTPISELPDTTAAARALLDEIGPTVRAIRERSRVPGELSLKRDVADRLREEVYISRSSLTARYAKLPSEYRHLFDAAGLGRSVDSVVGELPSAPASANDSRSTAAAGEHHQPHASVASDPAAWQTPSTTSPAQRGPSTPASPAARPSRPAVRPSPSMTVPAAAAVRPSQSMTVPAAAAVRPSQSPTIERSPFAADATAEAPTIPNAAAIDAVVPARPALAAVAASALAPAPASHARAAQAAVAPNGSAMSPANQDRVAQPAAANGSAMSPANHGRVAQPAAATQMAAAQARAPQGVAAVHPIASGTASLIHSMAPSHAVQPIGSVVAGPSVHVASAGPPGASRREPLANAGTAGPLPSHAPSRAASGTAPPPRMAAGSVYLTNQPEAPTVPRAPALPRLPGVPSLPGLPPGNAFDATTTRDETQPMVPAPNPIRPLPGVPVARIRPVSSATTPTPVTVTGEITVRR